MKLGKPKITTVWLKTDFKKFKLKNWRPNRRRFPTITSNQTYLCKALLIYRNEDNEEIVRNILLMLISVITNGPLEIKPQARCGFS